MRHRKKFNHLSRKSAHRNAMLSNMASSLILHKRINTTTAKAKALRGFVEPLITKSKEDSTHSRRTVFRYLKNKEAVNELFREVSVKVSGRPGGYTRILKIGNRLGDNAEMCIIELVDYNENMLADAGQKKSRRRRRKGGGSPKTSAGENQQTAQASAEETVAEQQSGDVTKAEQAAAATGETLEQETKEEPGARAETATEEKLEGEKEDEKPVEAKKEDDKKEEDQGGEEKKVE